MFELKKVWSRLRTDVIGKRELARVGLMRKVTSNFVDYQISSKQWDRKLASKDNLSAKTVTFPPVSNLALWQSWVSFRVLRSLPYSYYNSPAKIKAR